MHTTASDGFRITIIAFSPFTDMDLFVPLDLLGRARVPGWKVTLASDESLLIGSTGVEVRAQADLSVLRETDFLLVVSGRGVRRALATPEVVEALRPASLPRLKGIGSLDSGALLLAKAGWLRGANAATYPSARAELEVLGARYVAAPLVVAEGRGALSDLPVVTAGGCLSAVPLVEWILERHAGPGVAREVIASAASVGAEG